MLSAESQSVQVGSTPVPCHQVIPAQIPTGSPIGLIHSDRQGRKLSQARNFSARVKPIAVSGAPRLWKKPATQRLRCVIPWPNRSGTSSINGASMIPRRRPFFQKRIPTSGSSIVIQELKPPSSTRSDARKKRPLPSTQ